MNEPISDDLSDDEKLALGAMFGSVTGRVFVRWILAWEQTALNYIRYENDEVEIRRTQGDLRTVTAILDLIEHTNEFASNKEQANG
jgi:hypothetical protein